MRYPIYTQQHPGSIYFDDNEKIYFGNDNDASMYWDESDFIVNVPAAKEVYFKYATITGFRFEHAAVGHESFISGGVGLTDGLILRASSTGSYPLIGIAGNGQIRFQGYVGAGVMMYQYFPEAVTASDQLKGLALNTRLNVTPATNRGTTALQLSVGTKNGSGKSYAIDCTDMTNTDAVLNCLESGDGAPATWAGAAGVEVSEAPAGWIKIAISGTAAYIPYWT